MGVSESSLKRWCDKGLLETVRTAGGHRRVPYAAVMKFLRDSGRPMVRPDVLGLPAVVGQGTTVLRRAAGQLEQALVGGDETMARRVLLDLYLAQHPTWRIGDEVLAPALAAVGAAWECGDVAVYQERRACEIAERVVIEIVARFSSPDASAPAAVGGTLTGDNYRLPTLLCETVLREAGWRADSLGSSIPLESMEQAVADLGPRLCWLSVSHIDDRDALVAGIEQLSKRCKRRGAALVVGGRAIDAELKPRLKTVVVCGSLKELVDAAGRVKRDRRSQR